MVCLYRNDFLRLGGFNHSIHGWGAEDVDLYDRAVRHPEIDVFRATDSGIMHLWHDKECDRAALSEEQYVMCLGAKANMEGDKIELGKIIGRYRVELAELRARGGGDRPGDR